MIPTSICPSSMALLQTTFAPLLLACTDNETFWNWKHCLTAGSPCNLLQKNPVTLVPQLGVAYVEVRKSASEGIRSGLQKFFNSAWNTCGEFGAPSPKCSSIDNRIGFFNTIQYNRCTSSCLDRRQANTYFWFSFVRDPTERFYSGLAHVSAQSMKTMKKTTFSSRMVDDMLNTRDLACAFNSHTSSQLAHLRQRLSDGHRLPIDFLGRVEHIEQNFTCMLRKAEEFHRANGRDLSAPPLQVSQMLSHLTTDSDQMHHGAVTMSLKANIMLWRTELMDSRVKQEFKEDITCLGY